MDFYSRGNIPAIFNPEKIDGVWRNEYLDLVVDPADTPDYVPSEGAFWDRVNGQWMYDETTPAYSIGYDKTMLCWVDYSIVTLTCIPDERSAPRPIFDTLSQDWIDQYGDPITEEWYRPVKHVLEDGSTNYNWFDPRTNDYFVDLNKSSDVMPDYDRDLCMWIDTNGVANSDGIMELPHTVSPEYDPIDNTWQLKHQTMVHMPESEV